MLNHRYSAAKTKDLLVYFNPTAILVDSILHFAASLSLNAHPVHGERQELAAIN